MLSLYLVFSLAAASLEWVDYREQETYDLTSLMENSPYELSTNTHTLRFSIGKSLGASCSGTPGNVIRKSAQGCEIIGQPLANITHTTGNGLSITYIGVAPCLNNRVTRTIFDIVCSQEQGHFQLETSLSACDVRIQKLDPAGCVMARGLSGLQISL